MATKRRLLNPGSSTSLTRCDWLWSVRQGVFMQEYQHAASQSCCSSTLPLIVGFEHIGNFGCHSWLSHMFVCAWLLHNWHVTSVALGAMTCFGVVIPSIPIPLVTRSVHKCVLLCCLQPFYGQEIRLVVCGYVRSEANFTSLQALIDRIHKDAEVSTAALDHSTLRRWSQEPFLQPNSSGSTPQQLIN